MKMKIEDIKRMISRLKDHMINHFEQADPGENVIYYQGYAAGYAKGIDDALALFG